jgi:hypothetical protein
MRYHPTRVHAGVRATGTVNAGHAWKKPSQRLTSVQANRALSQGRVKKKKKRQNVDAISAAVLLQSYLDSLP